MIQKDIPLVESMMPLRPRPFGYALLWAIVTIAIIASIAAAALPVLGSISDQSDVKTTATILIQLDSGIVGFGKAVERTNGNLTYPGKLSQLATVPLATDVNGCGNAMPSAPADWAATGPFSRTFIPTTGVITPMGVVNNAIVHTTANGTIVLNVPAVDSAQVIMLDELIDGTIGAAAGRVQYSATAGVWNLQYFVGLLPGWTKSNQC